MHIIIIASQSMPSLSKQLGQVSNVLGGWIEGSVLGLLKHTNLNISFFYPNSTKPGVLKFYWQGINTFGMSIETISKVVMGQLVEQPPDVIHAYGTESNFVQELLRCFPDAPKVISVQGVMRENAKAFFKPLGNSERFNSVWMSSVALLKNLNALSFYKRSLVEKHALKNAQDIIGRTLMDKALSDQYGLNYHFNNETLRPTFYDAQLWSHEMCDKHRIYVSQGSYPLKGIHILIRALAMIEDEYPNMQCRIGGEDLCKNQAITHKWGISYSNFVIRLIEHYGLQDHVHYIGFQSEEQVINELRHANCFVMPSLMENSPNALGEAMLLGVPCIASRVGGIPTLLEEDVEGLLYTDQDVSELASKIKECFDNEILCNELSKNGRLRALKTHDIKTNALTLLDIYRTISRQRN